jgi:hypothetical protein
VSCLNRIATWQSVSLMVEGWAWAKAVGGLSGMPPHGMREDSGRTGQEETQTGGQERPRRRAVAVVIPWHGLASLCAMAAGAGALLVQHLRRRGGQRGHDETGGSPVAITAAWHTPRQGCAHAADAESRSAERRLLAGSR